MNTTSTPTKLQEIVSDVIEDMSESLKATFRDTTEDNLIAFHSGWGKGIRNKYNLWDDNELVKTLGAEHPDDASMIIIRAVWQQLQDAETHIGTEGRL